jgi:hypothetical protein
VFDGGHAVATPEFARFIRSPEMLDGDAAIVLIGYLGVDVSNIRI